MDMTIVFTGLSESAGAVLKSALVKGSISAAQLGGIFSQFTGDVRIKGDGMSLSADDNASGDGNNMTPERRRELLSQTATGRAQLELENDPDYACAKRARDAALRARGFEP